ncbi:hypothetical protein HYPSUDRAFT_198571 [Hypholoma sublateritium FD-334 SS-4]|uniref:Uncharacterized protein n=1 Tax=Hypholoma sublateritium (strain FD-334 SS-4) TaxID=945553 RepID=A0A0D2MS06_HYPSF|nr:hypothetical protein HYPSUDRAFT_198571 [Hypholoma sublateritium FD-334 SS-4]
MPWRWGDRPRARIGADCDAIEKHWGPRAARPGPCACAGWVGGLWPARIVLRCAGLDVGVLAAVRFVALRRKGATALSNNQRPPNAAERTTGTTRRARPRARRRRATPRSQPRRRVLTTHSPTMQIPVILRAACSPSLEARTHTPLRSAVRTLNVTASHARTFLISYPVAVALPHVQLYRHAI